MRLVRLEATDFAMHEALDLDLTATSAVAVVGENGAGKSRLLDAVVWSLFGRPFRGRPDQLIRRGQTSMRVRTTWEHRGAELLIERTRETVPASQSSLELWVDGERRTKHTIAETQAEILRLALPPLAVLEAGPIMAQGESDALMRADPRDRKEVLGKLFGLDEYEAFHEEANRRTVALENRLAASQELVRTFTLQLAGVEDPRLGLARLEVELAEADEQVTIVRDALMTLRDRATAVQRDRAQVVELDRDIAAVQQQLDGLTRRRAAAIEKVQHRPAQEEPMKVPDQAEFDVLEEQHGWCLEAEAELPSLIARIDRLKEAIEKNEALCDRCPFRTRTEELSALEARRLLRDEQVERYRPARFELARLRDDRDRAVAHNARVASVLRELEMLDAMEAQIAGMSEEIEAAGNRIAELNGRRLRLLRQIEDAADLTADLTATTELLTDRTATANRLRQEVADTRSAVKSYVDAQAELRRHERDVETLEHSVLVHGIVRRMFHRDGIPLMVLDRGLPLIEARANDVLARLPGRIQMSLQTTRTTRQGAVKEALEIVVDQDGSETVYDVLSGAERFRVDFALRLGVSEVLTARTGAAFDTLWLDEPFSAQSPAALETVLECLSVVSDDFGLMVVTTHQPEVADRFPARLVVTKDEGIATVALHQ